MCLSVITADLGDAHAVLHVAHWTLAFAPGLTARQRTALARRLLAKAGQDEPDDRIGEVVCLCGFGLDVSSPKSLAFGTGR